MILQYYLTIKKVMIMTFNKTGTALIIGGSSGMGFETAKLLAAYNIDVIIVGNINFALNLVTFARIYSK